MTPRQQYLSLHPLAFCVQFNQEWLVYKRAPNNDCVLTGRGATRTAAWKDALTR